MVMHIFIRLEKCLTSFFAMVLLSQIPVIDLKEIPAVLWSSAIDSETRSAYSFEVIGRVKHFHEITVGFFFFFVNIQFLILLKF